MWNETGCRISSGTRMHRNARCDVKQERIRKSGQVKETGIQDVLQEPEVRISDES